MDCAGYCVEDLHDGVMMIQLVLKVYFVGELCVSGAISVLCRRNVCGLEGKVVVVVVGRVCSAAVGGGVRSG